MGAPVNEVRTVNILSGHSDSVLGRTALPSSCRSGVLRVVSKIRGNPDWMSVVAVEVDVFYLS